MCFVVFFLVISYSKILVRKIIFKYLFYETSIFFFLCSRIIAILNKNLQQKIFFKSFYVIYLYMEI